MLRRSYVMAWDENVPTTLPPKDGIMSKRRHSSAFSTRRQSPIVHAREYV